MLRSIFYLIIGFFMLITGGNWLVKGSSRFSLRLGISAMVIGLTVVAFGTSAPEFMVSLIASIKKEGGIAVGNILGSNIANIALILGLSAIIKPIKVQSDTIKKDIPWLIISVLLFVSALFAGKISFFLGVVFLLFFFAFLYGCFKRKRQFDIPAEDIKSSFLLDILLVVSGLLFLLFGGNMVVASAVKLAKMLGISEIIIAVSIVAIGTSLPELFTSLIATLKDKQDIAVGNVLGSNIFNILWVLGVCALFSPIALQFDKIGYHCIVMVVFSVICIPVVYTGKTITRQEGILLVFGYLVYLFLLYAIR